MSLNHPQRIEPQPGQESVWDYPRPPRLERARSLGEAQSRSLGEAQSRSLGEAQSRSLREAQSPQRIKIVFNGVTIADSRNTYRVLETSHPPVYYIPPEDIKTEYLKPANSQRSFCEWKGFANYYDLVVKDRQVANAAWYYAQPNTDFAPIKNYVAFYPSKMDACYVDDEQVQAQAGDFYGGWITKNIVGPFKGEIGSWGW